MSLKSYDKGHMVVGTKDGPDEGRTRLTREESRARTRSLLIEAAGKVFAERGFTGASVEEITERAGFSRGAFYSNFGSKDDLFLAVLDAHIESEFSSLTQVLEGNPSPEAFFEYLRSRAIRRSREGREWSLLWAEFWLHVVRHPELAPKLASRQRAARSTIAAIIERQCGQLGMGLPLPAEDLASVMLAVDDGLVLQEHLDPTAVPGDLRARATMLLMQGAAVASMSEGAPEPE
jgi:AcrR family transcriptional regulator